MHLALPQIGPSVSSSSAELPRCARFSGADAIRLWPVAAPLLEPALNDPKRCGLEHIAADLYSGDADLWIVWTDGEVCAAVVTRMEHYARSKSLLVQLCGGRGMNDWWPLIDEIERHARRIGCRHVEVQGRRGWARVLPGYTELRTVIAKEV